MIKKYIWGTEDWLYEKDGLLIKEIVSNDKLSVQVHPDDEYAKTKGLSNGKTECWYVKDAKEDAFVYCGFFAGLTPKEVLIRETLSDGHFEMLLNKVFVKKGDFIFIPAGTVHAIGGGCTMIEVQQDSNTTYRFYDYNRLGTNGKPRELHVEDAIASIKENEVYGKCNLPFSCEYFSVALEGNNLKVIQNDKVVFETIV